MIVSIRLTSGLYDEVRTDLRRPHPFAAERVGFLFARLGNVGTNEPLVICTGYLPVGDDRYLYDPLSGARIDSQSIRSVMQHVLDRKEGAFHVHLHECRGSPKFSSMDREELPNVISAFRNAGPTLAHGMFLLSKDACSPWVWLPNSNHAIEAAKITVVGYPLQLFSR